MLQADEEHDVTPVLFNHNMFSKARRDKRRIVLPEGSDIRVVTAASVRSDPGCIAVVDYRTDGRFALGQQDDALGAMVREAPKCRSSALGHAY